MQDLMIALLTCSITMSALALFYMAITPLLSKRYSAKGRYYAWLIVVIGLIIPFRPQFNNAVVSVDVPPEMAKPIIQIGNGTPAFDLAPMSPLPAVTPSISLWQVLMIVWLAGVVISLVYHAIKHYRFVKLVGRWSESVTDDKIISVLGNLKSQMGVCQKMNIQLCASFGSPMMIGFIHPKILLPQIDFAPDELGFILAHELVHYKRGDLWYKALILLATTIHWFNPVVYMAAKAIDVQCEISCDNEVIRSTDADTRQQYSETIIGVVKYQSKLKTALSTNFYGGKKGMKKRIFSIMDMSKKKAGVALLCGALVLTLGTGFAFAANLVAEGAPENAPVMDMTTADGNQYSENIKWEPLPEYEQFGISYDANGKMLYNNQLVRYFWDGYEIEPGIICTHYDYLNEAGAVDVHTVRSIIVLGGGGVDMFGDLTDIVAYRQQEFDARDIDSLKGNGNGPVAESIAESSSNTEGRTFPEIFSEYKDYGIEFVPSTAGGIGNVYYQGKLVKTFIDEKNDGGVFTLSSVDGGDVVVYTVYDNNGNLTGVKTES